MKRRIIQYWVVIFAFILWMPVHTLGAEGYQREIIFEANAGEKPFELDLSLGYPNPFGSKPENMVEGPIGEYFDVTNSGNLIIQRGSVIQIINIEDMTSEEFKPKIDNFGTILFCISGPSDELYICLRKASTGLRNEREIFKLFRFKKENGAYNLDKYFDIAEHDLPPGHVRISPDGNIYIERWHDSKESQKMYGVYDYRGNYIKDSEAWCNTEDGTAIMLQSNKAGSISSLEGVAVNKEKANIFSADVKGLAYKKLKCTFDGGMAITVWHQEKVSLGSGVDLSVSRNYILVVDTKSGRVQKIDPYSECAMAGYDYINIGDVASDYNGNIYALVVYFNTPGKITGDEKIALYRWHKQ